MLWTVQRVRASMICSRARLAASEGQSSEVSASELHSWGRRVAKLTIDDQRAGAHE